MQFKKFIFGSLAYSLIVTISAISAPVIAEEATLAIEEIIVTARKREESVQDVPVAMTALSQELRDSTVRNLSDLTGYAPNVVIREGARGSNSSNITIRGVSASSNGDKSFDSPIAVSIDGVFQGTVSGRNVENFDLERIEVLRGPQGTLFGKNTVGGVINVIRSRPTGELGGKVRVTGGKYGQQEIRSLLNLPIAETLSAKLFYTQTKSDGHLKREFDGGRAPKSDYENFGIALLWEPNDRFDALLTVEIYNINNDVGAPTNFNVLAGYFSPPTGEDVGRVNDLSGGTIPCLVFGSCRLDPEVKADSVETNQPNTGNYRNNVISLSMNYDLNDAMTLVSVTGYHDTPYEDTISELDGTADDFIYIDSDNIYDQFSQEIRLEGTYDWGNFVIGGYYFESSYDQDWTTTGSFWQVLLGALALDTPGGLGACLAGLFGVLTCDPRSAGDPDGLGAGYDQRLYQTQDIESLAFFGQVDYNVTDQLILTAGVRHTKEDKHFLGYQAYQGAAKNRFPFNFDIGNADLENTWKETTLKFGLTYHYSDDIMFFASYAEGFKSGGFFGVNQNIRDFERNQYDPESAANYEVGVKSQWMENRLQVNGTFFYNDFKDKQDSNIVEDPETSTVATVWENIGGLEYTGVEVEARFVATENLDLFASIGWLNAEYNGFMSKGFYPIDELANNPPAVNVDFLTPKLAPDWTFGLGGTYTMQLGPGDLSIHAKWTHITEQETDTYNDPGSQIGAQDMVNAQIAYDWNNMRLSMYGNNLLNESEETTGFLPGLFGTGNVSIGTTWGIELEVIFGN